MKGAVTPDHEMKSDDDGTRLAASFYTPHTLHILALPCRYRPFTLSLVSSFPYVTLLPSPEGLGPLRGERGEYDVRRNEPRSPWCGPSLHLTDSSFSSVPVSLAFRSSITSALPFGHRKEN